MSENAEYFMISYGINTCYNSFDSSEILQTEIEKVKVSKWDSSILKIVTSQKTLFILLLTF